LRIFRVDVFATIQYNLCTLLRGSSNKTYDPFFQFFITNWTQIDALFISSSDLEALSLGL
jgi:hypothetical protein